MEQVVEQQGGCPLEYQSGLGNAFSTEAVPGALPVGRNSPQRPPLGLYAEQISGTPFTTSRASGRRTWTYRIRPSARHAPFEPAAVAPDWRTAPVADGLSTPAQARWSLVPMPVAPTDLVAGLRTLCAGGSAEWQEGCGIQPTPWARTCPEREADYHRTWDALERRFGR